MLLPDYVVVRLQNEVVVLLPDYVVVRLHNKINE